MYQTENSFFSERCSKLLKEPIYLSLPQMRENFGHNSTKLTMFVFVKSIKDASKGVP